MGLLDDAIRDHLELKRRRGADPSEIARLEHEALGPVRREPFEPTSGEAGSRTGVEDRPIRSQPETELDDAEYEEYYEEEYYDEEGGEDWEEPFDDGAQDGLERPRSDTGETDTSTASEAPLEHEVGRGPRRWRRHRRASVPPEEAPPTQAEAPAEMSRGEETVEYEVDEGLAERSGNPEKNHAVEPPLEDEGDVLEETPEFLQDAPEHDRLWFEQRPPRDFDFDD